MLVMTVENRVPANNLLEMCQIGNRIKYLRTDARDDSILFFLSRCIDFAVACLELSIVCVLCDLQRNGCWTNHFSVINVKSGCIWDANWNLFRKKQYHLMLVFGCPHRTTHLKCQKFKLIYDSPANLSLTAWWASAAWCNGGIAHASGVLCGGTRNTWPGLYSGYDEYNALAVEYGMPALAKCVANFACSASNSNEWVSRSDAGLLLLFSNGLDSRRDMLNGRFSLDERVCSDCIESLDGREKKQIKMHFYGIVFANWLSYALNGTIGGETTG